MLKCIFSCEKYYFSEEQRNTYFLYLKLLLKLALKIDI